MIPKENDMLLNMLANPQFTVTDFQSVGLTGDNTNLLSEDTYKASDKIRNHEFFQTDGEFDESKFHDFYMGAGQFYNQLAEQNYEQEILNQAVYSEDNMWVAPEKRKVDYSPKLTRQANENLVTSSLDAIGKRGPRTMSISEIAQTQQVYDTKTGEWKDSPNDSFFSNFFDTLVLATYDEDVVDEETGEVIHEKGSYKLNEDGTYYYETLGGRDVYGKQVLNKMNVLTTDGSTANKFDFFDSDDIEQKSIGGSILKNAALVGSMFLPGVGAAVRGVSVLTQMAGLTATLGKLFVGNESETLNNIQGWAKTVNRSSQTEYAANNTWCSENFLNMIGDTIGQLAEQRWIFKNAPYVLGDTKAAQAMGKKGAAALKEAKLKDLTKEAKVQDIMDDILAKGAYHSEKKGLSDYIKGTALLNEKKATQYVDSLVERAQDISSPLAKAYMTALTVQDTYGEARAAGASHMEAALLTVGYAAGEAAILNTGLGEWILPELQGSKLKMEAIAKAMTKEVREANEKYAINKSKKGWVQRLLDTGKKIANNQYAEQALKGSKALPVVGAHALGEAFEETSEEVLADLSKSIFNVTRWLRGEEALELGEWENMGDRYLMSALGGFIGGGLTSVAEDFSVANSLGKMDKTQAMQELLYLVNNGKEKEFLNVVNKMDLGNKHLSAKEIIGREGENVIWGEAKEGDNQDLAVKQLLKNEVNFIKNVLEAEGARISTESLLNKLTLEDQASVLQEFRLHKLQNTQAMGLYLQNFQNLQNDLVKTHADLAALNAQSTDSNEDDSEETKGKRSLLTQKLKDTQEQIQQYLTGNMVPEATRDALYEMNSLISNNLLKIALPFYAKKLYGRKWEELSDTEKEDAKKKHKEYMETNAKNDIHQAAGILYDMIELFSPFATQAQEYIQNLQKEESKGVMNLQKTLSNVFNHFNNQDFNNENFDVDSFINKVQDVFEYEVSNTDSLGLIATEASAMPVLPEHITQQLALIKQEIDIIKATPTDDTYSESTKAVDLKQKAIQYRNTLSDAMLEMVDAQVKPFIDLGHINPEIKQALLKSLDMVSNYAHTQQQGVKKLISEQQLGPAQERLMIAQLTAKYQADKNNIAAQKKAIKELTHTPILQYLDQFRLSTTNSDLNLTKHWEATRDIFADNQEDYSSLQVGSSWTQDNEEALNLVDAFVAVLNGMKVDNASFNNPTGFTKILNNIYKKQGVKDFIELTELDTQTADLMLQDAMLIKDRLEFAKTLSAVNQGQKLKQQDIVGTNKNFLLYKEFSHFVDVVPDDWEEKDKLKQAFDDLAVMKELSEDGELRLSKDQKFEVENDMLTLENAVYDFFNANRDQNGNLDSDKLGKLLNNIAGPGGFFQKTGELLTEATESLDKNSFIWWLASRAAVKATDFYGAYKNSLNEKIAPIPSQELATYLGVAAVANMDVLNSFVDAYRNTVVQDFNNITDEKERAKLLNGFDGSGDVYSKDLLKYFSGHNVLPQYKNMVFIEGAPGTGKSKGVFSNIINIVKQIDPDILKGAWYVHATQKAADEANATTGLDGTAFDRTKFLQEVSSEWKDTKDNIKTETYKDSKGTEHSTTGRFLYEDSFEFDNGRLVNKWKLNQIADAPKLIFIDEVTHYNQQELSMIEQFARENGIVVLTAGDLDQDTQVAYAKVEDKIADFTINRNNFMRSPKLGVTLRTLNKQMTSSVASTQAAMQRLNKGESANIEFNYLDKDPNHKGLYGVKTYQADQATLSDTDISELKKTIDLMVETSTGPIGYIYSDSNSKLYKYITDNYGTDKVIPYKDSDAQGLEGQYYIVENKRDFAGTTPSEHEQAAYMRSVYTGISRAEQGVLVVAPQAFGNNIQISSKEDTTFQLETITDAQKKKAYEARAALLDELIDPNVMEINPITIKLPSKETISRPSQNTPNSPGGLPPGVATPSIPERVNFGYTEQAKAQEALDQFNQRLQGMGNMDELVVDFSGVELGIKALELDQDDDNGIPFWTPVLVLENDERHALDEVVTYPIKNRTTQNIVQAFNVGDELTIEENGVPSNVRVQNANINNNNIEYEIVNMDDNTTRTIGQTELQSFYKQPYVRQQQESPTTETNDTGLENGTLAAYQQNVLSVNVKPEQEPKKNFVNRVYTFNTLEMGVSKDANGMPEFKGPQEKFDARIDNAIGLMKLPSYSNKTYDELKEDVAYIHGLINTIDDNNILANRLQSLLGLTGTVGIEYAIKSSAGRRDNSSYPEYDRYDIDDDVESLEHIQSDDDTEEKKKRARKPHRRKLSMIVTQDGKPVLEMTAGVLNSPITVLQQEIGGEKVYKEEFNTFSTTYQSNQGKDDQLYLAIQETIDKHDGGPNQGLIDLFKLWQFTSNGIFYLPNNFNLASNATGGVEIIERKGDYQLDGNLQFSKKFINIEEFAEDPRLQVSSIFASRNGMVGGREGVVKPGHSFVLVSDNPEFSDDKALVDQFVKQQDQNYTGKKEVEAFYIVPPRTSVSGWLTNQHNIWEKSAGNNGVEVFDIGNDFTAYRVLQSLMESGQFESLQSSDGTIKEVKQAVEHLDSIENKWQQETLSFRNAQEEAEFQKYKASYGEQTAREHMAILEQKRYLQTKPNWNIATNAATLRDKTLAKYLNSYLTNIVWYNTIGNPKPTYKQQALQAIEDACRRSRKPLTDIFYKPQYSKNEVGPFIKIQTRGKYSLGKSPIGEDASFQIGAKLDTRSFEINGLDKVIHGLTKTFYYDKTDKTYKLTSWAKEHFEKRYLGQAPVVNPRQVIADDVKRDYKKYFDQGILDENVLQDVSLTTREQILEKLAYNYTIKAGNYGFVYNGHLYLSKMEDPNLIIRMASIQPTLQDLSPVTLDLFSWGVGQRREVWFDVDNNGFIKQINSRCTEVKPVEIQKQGSQLKISDSEFNTVKTAFDAAYANFNFGVPLLLKKSADATQLMTKVELGKNTNAAKLIIELKNIRKKFVEKGAEQAAIDIVDNMLNYANSVATFNLNADDVVVLSDGSRFKIQSINGDQIIGVQLDNNNQETTLQKVFEDSDLSNMKKEEPECAPVTWKLI